MFLFGTLELFWQCGIICFSIELCNCFDSVTLFVFLLDFDIVPTVWHYLFLLDFGTVSDSVNIICFSMWLWNCSDSVALLVFLLTLSDSVHYLFFYGTLDLFQDCDIICFWKLWLFRHYLFLHYLFFYGLWNFPTVRHYLFVYWFRQCVIICFSIELCNCSDSVSIILFFYWTLTLFRQCDIICLSIGIWKCSDSVALFVFLLNSCNCSDSVALFVFLLDFRLTHYLFFY